jgi:hypothetical protein
MYFRSMGVWTVYAQVAFDFQHSQRAFEFAAKYGLTEVQLVVQFPDGDDEIVPVPDFQSQVTAPVAA